ncbi:MAG: sulfite exporter TauE/SafE family protein [Treponema sp.]|jgi:sulfite exporter TauE/SafE/copper chaperone CopZ/plastocyanin domain-containing protein|nr:sulfite exporter TauE/SafE family protein [Treponema sp.]
MKTETIRIGGMNCVNCQNKIEKTLKTLAGVEDAAVDFNDGMARVNFDETVITPEEIGGAIRKLGYTTPFGGDGYGADCGADCGEKPPITRIAGTLLIIAALYLLTHALGLTAFAGAFPLAESGMGYGMLFVIGLFTSVHCLAMCGGISLSQCMAVSPAAPTEAQYRGGAVSERARTLLPSILYNGGRVISYTVVGGLVGALGSAVSVSMQLRGLVQLAAGVFMVVMGINMLGFFPILRRFTPRLPRFFAKKIDEQKAGGGNPLIIGLLNGLMPCGPLQAMQIYALSTGNPAAGALSMFVFSLGTVPLMFGLGALSSFLSGSTGGPAFARRVMWAGAVLVTVMGLTMFGYGLNLSDINIDFAENAFAAPKQAGFRYGGAAGGVSQPVIENGVQIVNSTLSGGRYPAITVWQGIPVRWTIEAPAGSINGCNNRMIAREYGIEYRFRPGANVIEFTPERTGKFTYSCWMGMIRSSITVVAEGTAYSDAAASTYAGSGLSPTPAGVVIQTETAQMAEIAANGAYQTVTMNLRDDGMNPAVIIMQRGVPATWTINNDSLDPGNSRLLFPAYYTQIDIEQGGNVVKLMPIDDFDFSTADNVFYGYVKVVDDLSGVDIDAVKAEATEFETLIYPDEYFEQASGGCCAR